MSPSFGKLFACECFIHWLHSHCSITATSEHFIRWLHSVTPQCEWSQHMKCSLAGSWPRGKSRRWERKVTLLISFDSEHMVKGILLASMACRLLRWAVRVLCQCPEYSSWLRHWFHIEAAMRVWGNHCRCLCILVSYETPRWDKASASSSHLSSSTLG